MVAELIKEVDAGKVALQEAKEKISWMKANALRGERALAGAC